MCFLLVRKFDAATKSQQELEKQLERVRKELASKEDQLAREKEENRAKDTHMQELQSRLKRGRNGTLLSQSLFIPPIHLSIHRHVSGAIDKTACATRPRGKVESPIRTDSVK